MFAKSAAFYDALYHWKQYPKETEKIFAQIDRANLTSGSTLLDVACGTGAHLEHLRSRYTVEGLDLDNGLLAIARQRLGDNVPLHHADMLTFDLGRRFDVITCLFGSIAYLRSTTAMIEALRNFVRHLVPGGVLVLEPFLLWEQWQPNTVHAIHADQPEIKITRMSRSTLSERVVTLHFHYMVGTPQHIETFTEDHELALFTLNEYMNAMQAAGLTVSYDAEGLMGRGLFIGVVPR